MCRKSIGIVIPLVIGTIIFSSCTKLVVNEDDKNKTTTNKSTIELNNSKPSSIATINTNKSTSTVASTKSSTSTNASTSTNISTNASTNTSTNANTNANTSTEASSTKISNTTNATYPTTTKVNTTKANDNSGKSNYSGIDNRRKEWSYAYPEDLSAYSGIYNVGEGKIALTFDLGYETGYTRQLLSKLKNKGVKATFFVTGGYAEENPNMITEILRDGHKIGMHGYNHENMVSLSEKGDKGIVEDIEKWSNATGFPANIYRAPEGVYSKRGLTQLQDLGIKTVFWGVTTKDWDPKNQLNPSDALKQLQKNTSSGDVVLMHVFSTNVEIIDNYIDFLRGKSYRFIQP